MRLVQWFLVYLAIMMVAPSAHAADFDKAVAAYGSGNYEVALQEFRPLAEQGIAEAQYNLGVMYGNGEGVLADYKRAHMWLNIARYNGLKKAGDAIELVERNMTGSDISRAQDMAKRCVASDYKDC